MPLFGYICTNCETEQELLVRQGENPVCEHCGADALEKQLSHIAPIQGVKAPEPVGCGNSQCCQLQGGGCSPN